MSSAMGCTVDKQKVPVYFAVVNGFAEIVYFWHFPPPPHLFGFCQHVFALSLS